MARILAAAFFLALAAGRAVADDVLLRNGRAFEGVIAEVTGDKVRIRIPGGEVSLPRAQVLRIDAAESAYGAYVARRQELRARPATGAEDWLALARWALAHDLSQCAREAALVAAGLDPRLAGLEALMKGFGYDLEGDLGRFIPHDEWMTRRGFVHYEGRWMTGAEQEERLRVHRQERQEMAENAARLAAAREAAWGRAELADLRQRRELEVYLVAPVFAYPIAVFPGLFWPRPAPHSGPPTGDGRGESAGPPPPPPQQRIDSYLLRQPGSLLPGDLDLAPTQPLRAGRSGRG